MENQSKFNLKLAGTVLGKLATHIDERCICLGLVYLACKEDRPYDLTSLAAMMGVSRATLGRLVERLIAAGELFSKPDPIDRRRVLLSLTAAGLRAAETELQFIDSIMAEAAARRQSDAAHLIKPVKSEIITADQALPIIRKLATWANSAPDVVPMDLLDALYVCAPRLDDPGKTVIRHWGLELKTGGIRSPGSNSAVRDVISTNSADYYHLLAQHWEAGLSGVVMHQVEIDWNAPYKTYQRILIPHPRFGLFACSRFLDA